MKKTMKKVLALVLTVLMCVSVALPVVAADTATCPGADKIHSKATCSDRTLVQVVPTDCGDDGYTVYRCNTCQKLFADDLVPHTVEHNWKNVDIKKTCTTDGFKGKQCSNCKDFDYATGTVTPKSHNFDKGWVVVGGFACGTAAAKLERICKDCGHREEKANTSGVAAHDWRLTKVITEATCGVDGKGEFECDVCKATAELPIKATGNHNDATKYYVNAKDPTCTEDGYYAGYACGVCHLPISKAETTPGAGDGYDGYVVRPATHQMNALTTTPPTCTTWGSEGGICSVCGYSTTTPIKPTGHKNYAVDTTYNQNGYVNGYKAPTCTAAGAWKYTACENNCGITVDVEIPALNHVLVDYAQAADCAEGAYTAKKCTRCGEIIGKVYATTADAVDLTNHRITEVITPATCTTVGQKATTCVCGATPVTFTEIPELGHDYTIKQQKVAPTCADPEDQRGYTPIKCSRCDATIKSEYVPFDVFNKDHHVIIGSRIEVINAGSCTVVGYEKYNCDTCGVVTVKIDGTGEHVKDTNSATHYKAATPATCTANGNELWWKCTRDCGYIYNGDKDGNPKVLKKLGHLNYTKAKAPTCTEDGYDEYYDCTRCGVTVDKVVRPATGHTPLTTAFGAKATINATACGEYTYTRNKCKDCDYYEITACTQAKHNYVVTATTAQDCETDETKTWTCTTTFVGATEPCGDSYVELIKERRYHQDKDGNLYKCVAEGTEIKCARTDCAIATPNYKNTHIYDVVKFKATCLNVSYNLYDCVNCDYWYEGDMGVEKAEHDWKFDKTLVEEAPGVAKKDQYKCSVCKLTKEVVSDSSNLYVNFTVGSGIVAGAEIVNSGLLKVTLKTSATNLSVWGMKFSINFNNKVLAFEKVVGLNSKFDGHIAADAENYVQDPGIDTSKGDVDLPERVNVTVYAGNGADGKKAYVTLNSKDEGLVEIYFRVLGQVAVGLNAGSYYDANLELAKAEVTVYDAEAKVETLEAAKCYKYVTENNKTVAKVLADYTGAIPSAKVYLLGDLNKDAYMTVGSVATMLDASALFEIWKNEGKYNAMADINKNGKVDADDFGALMKYLADGKYNALVANGVN